MENRPVRREKNVTGAGKPIEKKGSGLGSGPVGRAEGYAGRKTSRPGGSAGHGEGFARRKGTGSTPIGGSYGAGSAPSGTRQTRSSGGGLVKIIIAAVVLLGGGRLGLGSLLGSGSGSASQPAVSTPYTYSQPSSYANPGSYTQQAPQQAASAFDISSLLSGSVGNVSSGWTKGSNVGKLDTSVDSSARDKHTVIKGGGKDTVTVMVYMCGTDLESKSGMASSDLQEMTAATISDKVNLIVYTGGCTQWKNSVVSNSCNQIYQVKTGGVKCLVNNAGTGSMTDPATLSEFIRFCTKNFPANRNALIFWDHGGGSLSGFGYDQRNTRSGSMTLKGINEALAAGKTSFDFIGFDACLMATLENALTVAPYADYLIASEETEPGVGWYYTDWLTALSQNTSLSTLDVGKKIADDFVRVCASRCSGQKTTLSVVDLRELEATIPAAFKAFATDTAELLENDKYKVVSDARSSAREFAASSKIDQVDLANLAYNLDTEEGDALAEAILGAVKYNMTSSNMTNAYGLSIYFPYQKASKVSSALSTYDAIGIDSEYARCIQQFATMESAGQAVSGGNSSPLPSLYGSMTPGVPNDMITGILNSLLSGGYVSYSGRSMDVESTAAYLADNRFDASALVWRYADGHYEMALSEEQWALVQDIQLNVFFDDGEGYIDLGCDNVFDFTDSGALLGEYDGTWLAIDSQPVAYYYLDTVTDGDAYTITGRIPVLLNGSRADLLLVFDSEHPYGYIAGARTDYRSGETETVAKAVTELTEGDEILFLCDYYSYDGGYQDSYQLGEPWHYHADALISNVTVDASAVSALYLITDLYCQNYWTPEIP